MSNIIDLDALVPDDKRVTLKGRTYTLPGDMPMATYLRVSAIAQMQDGGATQEDLLGSTVDALVELFFWTDRNADEADKERLAVQFRGMGVRTVMAIISKVYPSDEDDGADVDADQVAADPTPPASGTTTTTSPSE